MSSGQHKFRKSGSDYALLLFIGISAVATALLILAPLVSGILLSFFSIDSFSASAPPAFAGLANFAKVLSAHDFYNALGNGAYFSAASVFVQLLLAMAVALLLNTSFPGRSLVRAALVLPMLVPPVVATVLFRWMSNESFGIISIELRALGFDAIAWNTPDLAMLQIVLLGMWLWTPFMIVSILAELQSVPPALYEAARVDGANSLQRFFHITLPHLANVIGIIVLLRMIWTFNNFELIWLTTGGGPLGATETLPVLAYRQSFTMFNLGFGAAIATLSFAMLLAVVLVATRFLTVAKED